jgi:hypothetical protein
MTAEVHVESTSAHYDFAKEISLWPRASLPDWDWPGRLAYANEIELITP